jgi:two-component system, response regulator PdtaR
MVRNAGLTNAGFSSSSLIGRLGEQGKHEARDKAVTRLRLLIVEDDAIVGMLLAEMLEEMGYDVCAIAATEIDAVSAATRHKPDLMIVDAWLGKGSGVSAVEKILEDAAIPHLFVSGDVLKVKALRPDAIVIQKPFREVDLALAIERTLSLEGKRRC